MTYLVDSDWVADYLKGRPNAVFLLDQLLPQGIALSAITFGEVYEGIHYGSDPDRHETVFWRFLRGVTVLSIDQAVAHRYAIIRGDLRRRGERIGDPDVLIAATAIHHGLTLATRNLRDFRRVPGLALYPSP